MVMDIYHLYVIPAIMSEQSVAGTFLSFQHISSFKKKWTRYYVQCKVCVIIVFFMQKLEYWS